MKICFLCGEKDPNKMSLEHSIPKFLYGTKANDKFKKQEICKRCNNKLGIYVDMKFARSFPVYTALNRINKDNLYGFSSIIFNNNHQVKSLLTRNQYIEILVNVFCTIFWIKDNTEDFLTFPGGDPRLARNASKLYVFISERSINNSMNYLEKIKIIKDILTDIKKQFKKYKNIEILLCINFGITLAKNIKNKKTLNINLIVKIKF